MQDKKYFCYEIFKNVSIWSRQGKINYSPCSFYLGTIKTTDSINLAEVWNSAEHQTLKDSVTNDQAIPGCARCYDAEKHGLVSRRRHSKELYENYVQNTEIELSAPQGLDYSVGNLCNLKCVICGPENSTPWMQDYQKMYPLQDITKFKFDKTNQLEITTHELLDNVVNLHFHGGGDPLMSRAHINLLQKIKAKKGLADVRVFYNTNGTIRVSDEVLALWSECRLVELYFSIDDVGARFNYQRTGADWQQLQDNLAWYRDTMPVNHMFNINCSWGYLNIYYLNELVDWYEREFKTNRLGDATNLIFQKVVGDFSFDFASLELKQTLENKFKDYPTLQALVKTVATSTTKHTRFWDKIQQIDQVRATSYFSICPEWIELLNIT